MSHIWARTGFRDGFDPNCMRIILGKFVTKIDKNSRFRNFYAAKRLFSVVGVSGFEPEASWTRTKRDTKLRHTPIAQILY